MDWAGTLVNSRYEAISRLAAGVVRATHAAGPSVSDRIDAVVTHRVWGWLVLGVVMTPLFVASSPFRRSRWTGSAMARRPRELGKGHMAARRPAGSDHRRGRSRGVGNLVTFLPQILILFFFIGLLENTGYMARAAFIMDRLMSRVGLNGKSFIPLLSSYACAIPGIMATRTIEDPKDRLVTILVAPLMSCSARLPVYLLMIAALVPDGERVARQRKWA